MGEAWGQWTMRVVRSICVCIQWRRIRAERERFSVVFTMWWEAIVIEWHFAFGMIYGVGIKLWVNCFQNYFPLLLIRMLMFITIWGFRMKRGHTHRTTIFLGFQWLGSGINRLFSNIPRGEKSDRLKWWLNSSGKFDEALRGSKGIIFLGRAFGVVRLNLILDQSNVFFSGTLILRRNISVSHLPFVIILLMLVLPFLSLHCIFLFPPVLIVLLLIFLAYLPFLLLVLLRYHSRCIVVGDILLLRLLA